VCGLLLFVRSSSLCGVVWLCVRGGGGTGTRLGAQGGGIGAGFPSVTFGGPVTLTSYLLPVKRYWCWFWGRRVLICCVNGCQYNLDKILNVIKFSSKTNKYLYE